MNEETDPAAEVVALAKTLSAVQSKSGQTSMSTLASFFDVDPESTEIFLIIATLRKRFEDLGVHVNNLDFDDEARQDLLQLLKGVSAAFSIHNLTTNTWKSVVDSAFKLSNITPFRFLSPMLRQKGIKWPKLTDQEALAVRVEVDTLLEWLREQQLVEQDFIRQSLIEGLETFQFRLVRMNLYGWGYSVESLRATLTAYLALERGNIDQNTAPVEAAILRKAGEVLCSVFEKLQVAREGVSSVGDLIKWYGAASLLFNGASISGLLTNG